MTCHLLTPNDTYLYELPPSFHIPGLVSYHVPVFVPCTTTIHLLGNLELTSKENNRNNHLMNDFSVTCQLAGLQVLNGNPYNRKCDVYSFGICLWEIYCCDMPYHDLSFSEMTSAVVRQVTHLLVPQSLHPFEYWVFLLKILFNKVEFFMVNPFFGQYFHVEIPESETRDTKMLPKLPSKCNEAMLGRQPWQATRDGRGSFHVRGNWHIERWGYDPRWSASGLSLLPQVSWSVNSLVP